ncbi:hypothetical protein J503_1061 [Acinetobacter baumannii 984213]|nr:hypothetical protein CSB70_1038 [Acinetobacter baumannii]EKA73420.1 hypothetical protein ACINWC692_1320 [Acinetobacter baumannii WC-692]EKP31483.1 hypothetical protein ACIN5087_1819 [Acinetobacter baumannii OIFC087]EXA69417.1 hypothetical protein J503_1061 [Acinetobacter baumannii 984213]
MWTYDKYFLADSFSHFSIYQSTYSCVVGEILAPKEISIF